ncbi:MAG: hypothetical protein NVSMB44_16530 [Ktedonobacteraceae bacterium]
MERDQGARVRSLSVESLVGAAAGSAGTVPMTLFMLAAHRLLPGWQKYALPPEKITQETAERVDIRMDKPQLLGATLVAHLGYGASMGSLYSLFAERLALPAALKGSLFGIVVWGASYLGWLPAANFSVAAPDEPARRNVMMIMAHIVWGAVTGVTVEQIEHRLQLQK